MSRKGNIYYTTAKLLRSFSINIANIPLTINEPLKV